MHSRSLLNPLLAMPSDDVPPWYMHGTQQGSTFNSDGETSKHARKGRARLRPDRHRDKNNEEERKQTSLKKEEQRKQEA